jgi:hypothetical protein
MILCVSGSIEQTEIESTAQGAGKKCDKYLLVLKVM